MVGPYPFISALERLRKEDGNCEASLHSKTLSPNKQKVWEGRKEGWKEGYEITE